MIGATGLIATATGAHLIRQRFIRQAQAKVPQGIDSARVTYEHEVEKGQDTVRLTANQFSVRDATRVKDTVLLQRALRGCGRTRASIGRSRRHSSRSLPRNRLTRSSSRSRGLVFVLTAGVVQKL